MPLQVVHEFHKSLKVGEKGEEHILEYLRRSDSVTDITDVRASKPYQKIDVDFLVTLRGTDKYMVEVKTDTYLSGNMYYETMSSIESGTLGGFEITKADYLFYYFINSKHLYIFSMPEYKKWFASKKDSFDKLGYQKRPINKGFGNTRYTSLGYAFPISLLEDEKPRWMRKVYINY